MMSPRRTTTYQLPLQNQIKIANIESVKIRFEDTVAIDIGCICYLKRKKDLHGFEVANLVDESSIDHDRRRQVRSLIKHFSLKATNSALRPKTLASELAAVRRFIDWCDDENMSDVLSSPIAAKKIAVAYSSALRHRFSVSEIALSTASRYQEIVLNFLSEYFEDESFSHGIYRINRGKDSIPTEPPNEFDQAKVLSVCDALFFGMAELTIEAKNYPHSIKMPERLNYPNNLMWVFPTAKWQVSVEEIQTRVKGAKEFAAYNYGEGRLATFEEVKLVRTYSSVLASAQKILDNVNSDPIHPRRLKAAIVGLNAFLFLFMANTGMNWAQATELPWSDGFLTSSPRQNFRAIKFRAGGKTVSFEIQSRFLGHFKRFLELRNYILRGESFDLLFFGLGQNITKNSAPKKLQSNMQKNFISRMQQIDKDLPRILSRQWRAAKSDYFLRHHDISTTALILQSSEEIIKKNYAAGSPAIAINEMSSFLEKMAAMAISDNSKNFDIPTAVGKCTGGPNPKIAIQFESDVSPDCKTPEGCFFCVHYRIHADSDDLRKILSCKYCILKTAHLADTHEHFEALFGPVIQCIDKLVEEIGDISQYHKSMVFKISNEILEGELDPYWSKKLEMLINLGLVNQ